MANWIPISVDRPKENEELLITIRASIKNVVLRGFYCQEKFCVTVNAGNCLSTHIPVDDRSVIAWMLLPKPYEEEENELA